MFCALCRKDISLPGTRRNLDSPSSVDLRSILLETFQFFPQESVVCRECSTKLTRIEKLKYDIKIKSAKLTHARENLIEQVKVVLKSSNGYTIRSCVGKNGRQKETPLKVEQGTQTESENFITPNPVTPRHFTPIRPKRKKETPDKTPTTTKRHDVRPTPKKPGKRHLFSSPWEAPSSKKPESTAARVTVVYDSQTKSKDFTEADSFFMKVCKYMVRGEKKKLGHVLSMDPIVIDSAVESVSKSVSAEVKLLTSKKHCSYLQHVDSNSVLEFNWRTFETELKLNSPKFYSVLNTICDKSETLPIPVLFSAATILRQRNPKMSAAHHLVSLLLDDGGCKDMGKRAWSPTATTMAEAGPPNLVEEIKDIKQRKGDHQLIYVSEEVELKDLKPGDHLAVKHKQLFVSYYHHGIYLGLEEGVADFGGKNLTEMKVGTVDLAQFMKKATLLRINYPTGTCLAPEATVKNAQEVVLKPDLWGPYDLLRNNCEHFAIRCKTGMGEISTQALKQIEKCLKNPIKRFFLRKSRFVFTKMGIK